MENVHRQLKVLKWSQAELARRLRVSQGTVSRWQKKGAPYVVLLYLNLLVGIKEYLEG
jgi:transcriptional regulator with XRE-family HTH domain